MRPRLYIVVRVDRAHPPVYFNGYADGRATTTRERSKAVLMTIDVARGAVEALKEDVGGLWGIRKV